MATNPLQLNVEWSPNQKVRNIRCKSKSATFKRIVLVYANKVEYFSGTAVDKDMKLVNKETTLVIKESPKEPIPVTILFLVTEESNRGVPVGPFHMLIVEEPIFHNMKMTHLVEVRCNHPKTNELQCILEIEIPMS